MSYNSVRFAGLIVFVAFVLAGCAPDRIYRNVYDVCNVPSGASCNQYSLQEHKEGRSEYMLGFVEIDDQGQLRDRQQMNALIEELYKSTAENSALINVYVHGWHHNASPEDENVKDFNGVLAGLAKAEGRNNLGKARKVIGVYVGWRGESIDLPLANFLTFWDRKNTAQEVGYLGMTELLLRLEKVVNDRNESKPLKKNRLVVIGHSFGGAVVYSATAQILLSRYIENHADKHYNNVEHKPHPMQHADGFGDLVVLLNPAFEALRYAPAFDLAQAECGAAKVPRLAILTSETDYATGKLFNWGRVFTTVFETHSDVKRNDCSYPMTLDEGEADRNTAGHYMPLVSHRLTPLGKQKANHIINDWDKKLVWDKQTQGGTTQFGQTLLTHLNKTNASSPYLNIRVDKALMDGHNDILRDDIKHFLALLIHMSTSNGSSKPDHHE
jgi:hypothetical protein